LEGIDNGANFFSNFFQELGNRPSRRRVDVISERYKPGDLDLIFKLSAYGADTEYDVIFTPLDVTKELEGRARGEAGLFQAGARGDAALNQQSVLCLAANPVQCPNQVSVPPSQDWSCRKSAILTASVFV
jgi:hypothetical protein